jgi:hypothetical protein
MRGAPILKPVTGAEHRVRIVQPNGFEVCRGRDRTRLVSAGPVSFELARALGNSLIFISAKRAHRLNRYRTRGTRVQA